MENITDSLNDERAASMVNAGCWRLVFNRRRARLLKNRGEEVRWSNYFQGWLWLGTDL